MRMPVLHFSLREDMGGAQHFKADLQRDSDANVSVDVVARQRRKNKTHCTKQYLDRTKMLQDACQPKSDGGCNRVGTTQAGLTAWDLTMTGYVEPGLFNVSVLVKLNEIR